MGVRNLGLIFGTQDYKGMDEMKGSWLQVSGRSCPSKYRQPDLEYCTAIVWYLVFLGRSCSGPEITCIPIRNREEAVKGLGTGVGG